MGLTSQMQSYQEWHPHIISSFVFHLVKHEYINIISKSRFLIGNGLYANFWIEEWCGLPLISSIQNPSLINVKTMLSYFLYDGSWFFPNSALSLVLDPPLLVRQVTLPLDSLDDSVVWTPSKSGCLSLKDVLALKSTTSTTLTQPKHLWNFDIPPFKAFLVWRLCHNKVSTDIILSL